MTQNPENLSEREELLRLRAVREHQARIDAEAIAEKATRDLYDRQRELLLLQRVAAAANQASSVDEALEAALDLICEHTRWPVGHAYLRVPEHQELLPTLIWHFDAPERFTLFKKVTEATPMPMNVGLPGRVMASGKALWIVDVTKDSNFPRAKVMGDIGVRAGFGFPVMVGTEVAAVLEFFSPDTIEPNARLLEITTAIGAQLGRVIERHRAQQVLRELNAHLQETLEELQKSQKQIIQQERLKALGQMASGVAHDINNALSPITGYSELLLKTPPYLLNPETVIQYCRTINTAGMDVARMVQRLRSFYIQGDQGEDLQAVNLGDVISDAVEATRPRWKDQALSAGINIHVDFHVRGTHMITGDPSELREVFTNLIFNSVDAMKEDGRIVIWTESRGSIVTATVSDTGPGMTEEVRQRCMDPFFSTKQGRGRGMGLALVYGIVKKHGGNITIDSRLGIGTSITIELPARTAGVETTRRLEENIPIASKSVLVVDDEPEIRSLLTEFLSQDGHKVVTAKDGLDGMEKFDRGSFDVVVTDRAMPNANGDQLASHVKKTRSVPVIMLTGFGDIINRTGERVSGVDLILSKPVSGDSVCEALRRIFTTKV